MGGLDGSRSSEAYAMSMMTIEPLIDNTLSTARCPNLDNLATHGVKAVASTLGGAMVPPSRRPTLPTIPKRTLRDLPSGALRAARILSGPDQWYYFATAYREAAIRLADSVIDGTGYNLLGAPLLFLYRHHVELHLKSILLDAGELLDDPQEVPVRHELVLLWERVRKLLLTIDGSSDGAWLERAGAIIGQFDALDPSSFAFRYPVDKKGLAALPTPLLLDPALVREIVAELDILLNGASIQISEYQSLKNEAY